MKKIFFTYSDTSEDVTLYKELKLHFTPYARKGLLEIIDRDELFKRSGDTLKTQEILLSSDVTVPLISIDYLNNDECVKLLEIAAQKNRLVIPVLLRECEWDEFEKLKGLGSLFLPVDKQPVKDHIKKEGSEDKIMSAIARKLKAVTFENDLARMDDFEEKTRVKPKKFYYIITSILALIGVLAASIAWSLLLDWRISVLIFLMFLVIGLFAGKKAFINSKLT